MNIVYIYILALCPLLSIVVHLGLSRLIPSQAATSLGIVFVSLSQFFFFFFSPLFLPSPSPKQATTMVSQSQNFLREAKCRVLAASSG